MRYSYAWGCRPAGNVPYPRRNLVESYVSLTGILWGMGDADSEVPQWYILSAEQCTHIRDTVAQHPRLGLRPNPLPNPESERTIGGRVAEICPFDQPLPLARLGQVMLITDQGVVYVDRHASRFHPASIAGLVVGAMGCFIFGLYLRRWLRERKALASEPPQDMIA